MVKKVRSQLKVKKVGHAGTLDPLATGLLILCTGKKTKEISKIQELEKEYVTTMVIGATTPSVDLETAIENHKPSNHITREDILELAPDFTGTISQIPPAFSAIKVGGKRAYEKARAGQAVELKARQVQIKELEFLQIDIPTVTFRVVCSKGTYIRSLVRDFGEKMAVGAYISALRRTRIGNYRVEDAAGITDFMPSS